MKAPPWPVYGSVSALYMTLSVWESNINRFDRDVAEIEKSYFKFIQSAMREKLKAVR